MGTGVGDRGWGHFRGQRPSALAWTVPRGDVVEAVASQTATSCGRHWPFPGQTEAEDTLGQGWGCSKAPRAPTAALGTGLRGWPGLVWPPGLSLKRKGIPTTQARTRHCPRTLALATPRERVVTFRQRTDKEPIHNEKGSCPSHPLVLAGQMLFHPPGLGVCVMGPTYRELGALDSSLCFTTNILCDFGHSPIPLWALQSSAVNLGGSPHRMRTHNLLSAGQKGAVET